jgi:hypothetical protein
MSGGGRRHAVPVMAVGKPGSILFAATEKTSHREAGPKAFQVLVSELIDANDNDQARRFVGCVGRSVGYTETDNKAITANDDKEAPHPHELLHSLIVPGAVGPFWQKGLSSGRIGR